MLMLSLLSRSRLDAAAYDRCVLYSPGQIPYAFSWYLDAVSPGWMALVEDDYAAVMPLPVRRRFGVPLVHQPLFCHRLGVFAPDGLTTDRLRAFGRAARNAFPYGPVYALPIDQATSLSPRFRQSTNHVLPLHAPYERLFAGYSGDRKANLRRGQKAGFTYLDTTDPEPVIALFRQHNTAGIGRVDPAAYEILRRLVAVLRERGRLRIRLARRADQIEAGCLLVEDERRLIHLFCGASPSGRRGNARTVILDSFIREYAGQPRLFDFESPEAAGCAAFNRSFGAKEEPYGQLSWNDWPRPVRWLQEERKQWLRARAA